MQHAVGTGFRRLVAAQALGVPKMRTIEPHCTAVPGNAPKEPLAGSFGALPQFNHSMNGGLRGA